MGLWGIRWDYGAVGMWDYGTIWHSSGAWVFVQTYTLPGSPGSTGLGGIMVGLWGIWGIKGDYGVVGVWDYGLRELCDFLTWLCLPSGSPGSTGLGGIMGIRGD